MQGQGQIRRTRRWPYLVGVAILAALAVGVAIAVSNVFEGGSEDRAIGLVPEDAAAYASVFLDPSVSQKLAAKGVLDRVGGAGEDDGQSLDDAIAALVGAVSSADYESDLKPYLGDQIAAYKWPGEVATLLAATDDPRESRLAMHHLLESEYPAGEYRIVVGSYHGQPYEHAVLPGTGPAAGVAAFTILDGFVVLGSERGVTESIGAHVGGTSLADSEDFSHARSGLPGDALAFAYIDPATYLAADRDDEYRDRGESILIGALASLGPVAATLTAGDDGAALELSAEAGSGDAAPFQNAADLLQTLPADAIAAVSLGDLEGPLHAWLDGGSSSLRENLRDSVASVAGLDLDRDVAPWLGGLAAYVSGSDEDSVEGAVVAETRSSSDSDAVIDRVGNYYEDEYYEDDYYGYEDDYYEDDPYGSPVQRAEDGLGFDVFLGEDSLSVRGDEDRVVAGIGASGFSAERALDAEGGFGDSELYGHATDLLGGDFEPFLAVDAPAARGLFEQLTGATANPAYYEHVEGWLASLETIAAGVRTDGDRLRAKLAVGVR